VLVVARTQLAEALDCPGQSKLRTAEALDEVAAAADTQRLEVAQLAVDGAVAAGNALAANAVPRDDALPLEQELGKRAPVEALREEPRRQRPAPLRRGDVGGAVAGEATRPRALPLLGRIAAARSQRRPRIVCHLPGPDELPERGQRHLRLQPRRREQI